MNSFPNRKICPNQLELSTKDIDLKKIEPNQKILLNNGLEVATFFSESTELIKLDFIFEAGTYQQTKSFEASFTNYLLTEGTTQKTAREIADFLDFRGAYIEKNVEKETATLSAYFLEKYSKDIIPLLYEIVYEPAFPEHELEIYTQKRKQQFLIDSQRVNFVAHTRFSEMIFGKNHPYGKIGKLDDFDNLSVNDLKSFHDKFYRKNHLNIIASGYVNANFLDILSKYFGEKRDFFIPAELSFPNPSIDNPQQLSIPMPNAVQSAIRIGKASINCSHPDYPLLLILNTLLGGYFGSRLMKNIREEKGYTYGIYSIVHSFKKSGVFFISAEVAKDVTHLTISEILRELKRLCTELIPLDELNLVKNYLIGEFVRSIDGVFELSERYKSLLQLSQDYNFYQSYLNAIASIDPEKLQNIATTYLNEDTMNSICVG